MAAWSMSKILVIVNVPCPKANKCTGHTLEIMENGAVFPLPLSSGSQLFFGSSSPPNFPVT